MLENQLPYLLEMQGATRLDSLMAWLKELTPLVDWAGISLDKETILRQLRDAGFKSNQFVGEKEDWFNTRERLGLWIIGQAMNCMEHGMGPHPMTVTFCEKYFATNAEIS